jgi:hypothetical protein
MGENNNWFESILKPIKGKFAERTTGVNTTLGDEIKNNPEKQSYLGNKLANGLDSLITTAAQRNADVISGIQNKLNPEGLSNMELLTSTIDKSGNVFRGLFAGLLSIGSDIMGFFGALWVDDFSKTQNWEKNAPNMSNIFAKFFSFIFAERQSQPMATA